MFRFVSLICALGITLLAQTHVLAQNEPEAEDLQMLRQEIEKLRAGQQRLQKELQGIKALLSRGRPQPVPQKFEPTVLDIRGEPIKGKKDARVTLVDFTDYQ